MMHVVVQLLVYLLTLAPVPTGPEPDPFGRGYLGVLVSEGGLRISTINPNTPAERAGLLAGDDFVKVGELKPQNFEDVRNHISSFRPGTELTIVVRRGGETKTVRVKLIALPSDLTQTRGQFPLP